MIGPWYISARAVREYLSIVGRPDDDGGPQWAIATEELQEMARYALGGSQLRKPVRGHLDLLVYRGPKPLRLGLVVSEAKRPEGPLNQLVSVNVGHAVKPRRGT